MSGTPEPVLKAAAVTVVLPVIDGVVRLLNAIQPGLIGPEIAQAIDDLVVPLTVVIAAVMAWWARDQVTPVSSPALPEGSAVKLYDPASGDIVGAQHLDTITRKG